MRSRCAADKKEDFCTDRPLYHARRYSRGELLNFSRAVRRISRSRRRAHPATEGSRSRAARRKISDILHEIFQNLQIIYIFAKYISHIFV